MPTAKLVWINHRIRRYSIETLKGILCKTGRCILFTVIIFLLAKVSNCYKNSKLLKQIDIAKSYKDTCKQVKIPVKMSLLNTPESDNTLVKIDKTFYLEFQNYCQDLRQCQQYKQIISFYCFYTRI